MKMEYDCEQRMSQYHLEDLRSRFFCKDVLLTTGQVSAVVQNTVANFHFEKHKMHHVNNNILPCVSSFKSKHYISACITIGSTIHTCISQNFESKFRTGNQAVMF